MRIPDMQAWQAMRNPNKPALLAVGGALETLWHWSSVISVLAIVPVAHLLTVHGGGDQTGAILGASFAVFALLLPTASFLRSYVDNRTTRLQEDLRQPDGAAGRRQRVSASITILETQRKIFERLIKVVSPLQRGVVLAMAATIASSAAVIAPNPILWKHAPGWLVFSLAELLAALALVCLVGSVAAFFPFTWHLLVRSEQLEQVKNAIVYEQQNPQADGDYARWRAWVERQVARPQAKP